MKNNHKGFFLAVLAVLFISQVFPAGNKDANGLRQGQYDSNGWYNRNGEWVASPKGAIYADHASNEEEIAKATFSEDEGESDRDRIDEFDRNGWVLRDGKWVSSPDGALYKDEEHKNLNFSIAGVINRMTPEEKGMLKVLLLYGSQAEKKAGDIIRSPENLREYGKDVNSEWFTDQLNKAFTTGTGFMDYVLGRNLNYGKQLDIAINDYLVKAFNIDKPTFTNSLDTIEGAMQRETWIMKCFLSVLVSSMSENERYEIIIQVNEELKKEGSALEPEVIAAFSTYGVSELWKMSGIKPYIVLSKITKWIGDYVLGRTIPFVVYQTISTVAKRIFGVVLPIIGIALTIKAVYDLPGMINPREYDKFVPAVLLIGLCRQSQGWQPYWGRYQN